MINSLSSWFRKTTFAPDRTCAICQEDIDKQAERILACNHLFHKTCIALWDKAECPTCRVIDPKRVAEVAAMPKREENGPSPFGELSQKLRRIRELKQRKKEKLDLIIKYTPIAYLIIYGVGITLIGLSLLSS